MVLISFIHNFIYIKNRKVAGTSVENVFQKYCVSPDLSNQLIQSDMLENVIISKQGIIGNRSHKKTKWTQHKKAVDIKKDIGDEKFNKYFKFCVIRNPWDMVVSYYHHSDKRNTNFTTFVKTLLPYKKFHTNLNDIIYRIDDNFVCDFHIRYEKLERDIKKVFEILSIKDEYKLSHFKK